MVEAERFQLPKVTYSKYVWCSKFPINPRLRKMSPMCELHAPPQLYQSRVNRYQNLWGENGQTESNALS